MFSVGSILMHPSSGVCILDDIREENFSGEPMTYYVMHPVEKPERSTVYVPVNSQKLRLRELLNKEQIIEVLKKSADENVEWIDNNNVRKTTYSAILHGDDLVKLVAMVTRMYRQKEKVEALGKKFPVTDERLLHDAQKRIDQEFSYALNITMDEISVYIVDHLKKYKAIEV